MINFIKKFDNKGNNLGFFMSVKLNYLNKTTNKSSSNLVLFCDDKFNTSGLKKASF